MYVGRSAIDETELVGVRHCLACAFHGLSSWVLWLGCGWLWEQGLKEQGQEISASLLKESYLTHELSAYKAIAYILLAWNLNYI